MVEYDQATLWIGAFRYYCGRKTYAVQEFCNLLIAYNLGYYSSAIEAAKAYDERAKQFFGEFAALNFKEVYV